MTSSEVFVEVSDAELDLVQGGRASAEPGPGEAAAKGCGGCYGIADAARDMTTTLNGALGR
jgi:hypothetical protein